MLLEQLVPIEIGRRIEDVRIASRLTQRELADALGISPQSVSHLERGELRLANVARIRAVANACADKGWFTGVAAEAVEDYLLCRRHRLPIVIRPAAEGKIGGSFVALNDAIEELNGNKAPAEAGAPGASGTSSAVEDGSVSYMSYIGHVQLPAAAVLSSGEIDDQPASEPESIAA